MIRDIIEREDAKGILIAISLIILNIALIGVLAYTPLNVLLDYAFEYLIIGVLIYGVFLTGGVYIAKKGITDNRKELMFTGIAVLQFAYGTFGAGIIKFLQPSVQIIALSLTAVVTTFIALIASLMVYGTEKNYSKWAMYSTYLFLGVVGVAFFGTFLPYFGLVAFILALLGFFTYLVHEIWMLKSSPENYLSNGLGIYVAFMGVFVQLLQIIARNYLER